MNRNLKSEPGDVGPLSHVVYHILLALATGNRHGYGIVKHVSARTHGRLTLEAGTLYAAIKRLKDQGWIKEAPREPDEDSRRRIYAITASGRRVLLAESRRLESMVRLARDAAVLPG